MECCNRLFWCNRTQVVIALALLLWRQCHVMWCQRHIIKVDPRCTSEVWFIGIGRGSSDCRHTTIIMRGSSYIMSAEEVPIGNIDNHFFLTYSELLRPIPWNQTSNVHWRSVSWTTLKAPYYFIRALSLILRQNQYYMIPTCFKE